ncbi:MAG: LrgB family protein [Rhodobiaceae bacterium]|nr:LrgB family protein [Rhodobiaceae bacterium]MCC0057397.1 LrgB family protein [Rhodobiaceae bacterium]
MNGAAGAWSGIVADPLLHLTVTLAAYGCALWAYRRSGRNPLLNPVLISIALVIAFLLITGTPYRTYFDGARFIHFLLGPATVALAIPLYRHFDLVRRSAPAIAVSLVAGSLTAASSAVLIGWLLGASPESLISLAPKSVTAPVAMGITQVLGGIPSLTAGLVILTGILGAMTGTLVLRLTRVRGDAATGLAIGTASHGIGTARALQISDTAGAFSGLAMGLNALLTAIVLPIVWKIFAGG